MKLLRKIKLLEDTCKNPRSYAHQLALNLRLACAIFGFLSIPFSALIACAFAFKMLLAFFQSYESAFVAVTALFLVIGFFAMSYLDYKHNRVEG